MGYQNMNLPEHSQCIKQMILPLMLAVLFIITPTTADDDKYYGAYVGNFENRFHGISGEASMIKI
jgi:hypothetical protein